MRACGRELESDDLRYLFDRTTVVEPLSPEEERSLTEEFVARRREWYEAVLSSNLGQRRALVFYRNAAYAGKRALKRNVSISRNEELQGVQMQLAGLLPELEALVSQGTVRTKQLIEKLLCCPEDPSEDGTDTHEVLELMSRRSLSYDAIRQINCDMQRLLSALLVRKEHWSTPGQCPALTELISEHLVWPQRFERSMERVGEHFGRWKKVQDSLVLANMRLVVNIAKRFRGRGLQFRDLISDGVIGLMRSIWKFEPEQGYKLSSYATKAIRQRMKRSIYASARAARLPEHTIPTYAKIKEFCRMYRERHHGSEPSEETIADALGLSAMVIGRIRSAGQRTASLDAAGHNGDDPFGTFLADDKASNPIANALRAELSPVVDAAMRRLPSREREIIALRYRSGLTLEEAGRTLGICKERVRQIQNRAEGRLRNILKDYNVDS